MARGNQHLEAMVKAEQAVAEVERAYKAGEEINWQGRNGFRFAARLAREDFLDSQKSLAFCDRLLKLAGSDYWRVPARLEKALTYRAMGDTERGGKLRRLLVRAFRRGQQLLNAAPDGEVRQTSLLTPV